MLRRKLLWKWAVALVLALGVGAVVFANYVAAPGVAVPEVSPGPLPFNVFLMININPAPGFGDIIYALEEGRDDRGPFCSVTWAPSPANPINPMLAGIPAPIVGFPGGLYPAAPPGFYGPVTLIYRPTNDPANPGWPALPGAALQSDSAMRTAHQVCENFDAYRTFVPPAGVSHWINIEADLAPASPTFMEFYKFRVVH